MKLAQMIVPLYNISQALLIVEEDKDQRVERSGIVYMVHCVEGAYPGDVMFMAVVAESISHRRYLAVSRRISGKSGMAGSDCRRCASGTNSVSRRGSVSRCYSYVP